MRSTVLSLLGVVALAMLPRNAIAAEARPDALLTVDQHRSVIIERTIAAWPDKLSADQAEAIRATLSGLRADQLLAISLTPELNGLLSVLGNAEREDAKSSVWIKALGDANADLTYTPITPCRVLDTHYGTVAPYNVPMVGGTVLPVAVGSHFCAKEKK